MSNRLVWLDVAKGIAILLMVIGHTSIPGKISNFIWSFHMPLFFIASGWTTNWKKNVFLVFVQRKTQTLIVPFVIYSFVILWISVPHGWVELDLWFLQGWGAYALWFIPILFFSSLLAKLIINLKKQSFILAVSVIFLTLGCVLSYYKIHLPWNLSSLPFATFLVIIGAKLKEYEKKISSLSPKVFFVLLGINFGISQFFRLDTCFNSILPIFPIVAGAISGTLMIMRLSIYVNIYCRSVSVLLQKIGKESFLIVAFSQIIIMLLNEYLSLNAVLKYSTLIIVMVVLGQLKNRINGAAKFKLL